MCTCHNIGLKELPAMQIRFVTLATVQVCKSLFITE
jgi:hypothetical protein